MLRSSVLASILLVLFVAASCSSGDSDTGTAGCDEPLAAPGEYEGFGTFRTVEQPYWMVVPQSYDEITPAPLYLHLASGTGDHNLFMDGWRPYMDTVPGLMALVNTAWGGRSSPEALVALVDQISSDYCVDPNQIHVIGASWSGGMAEDLACSASERIASFSASMSVRFDHAPCSPDRSVPLLSFTGDEDRQSVEQFVGRWVEINGCDPEPQVENLGSGVHRKTFLDCDADVVFYDIEGMGHVYPLHEAKGPATQWIAVYEEVDYLEEVYKFFAEHPLP